MSTSEKIKVAIKVRPLIKREKDQKSAIHWRIQGDTIECTSPAHPFTVFSFGKWYLIRLMWYFRRKNIIIWWRFGPFDQFARLRRACMLFFFRRRCYIRVWQQCKLLFCIKKKLVSTERGKCVSRRLISFIAASDTFASSNSICYQNRKEKWMYAA